MVSILIPCYNAEKFIDKCVKSCINQTYKDIKIILVNDGSTDNTLEKIKQLKNLDPRISYYSQKNKGLAYTRNVLISKVETEWFFFLDSDDWLENDAIDLFVKESQNQDMVLNSCFISKKGKSKPFYSTTKIIDKNDKEKYVINNVFFAWSILYRTQFIKDNDLSFDGENPFFEDAGVMLYFIYKAKNLTFLNNPKYHYFINDESLSRKDISLFKINSALNQLSNLYKLFKKEQLLNKWNKWPKYINDQFCFYHCVIFTMIAFQSKSIAKKDKRILKKQLKQLEKDNFRLKFPKRYYKFWYFLLYRLFGY